MVESIGHRLFMSYAKLQKICLLLGNRPRTEAKGS